MKQIAPVRLSVEQWIPHWDVTRAISEAYHPDRRRASGVWILTNKTLADGPAAGLPYRITEEELHDLGKV